MESEAYPQEEPVTLSVESEKPIYERYREAGVESSLTLSELNRKIERLEKMTERWKNRKISVEAGDQ